ncbi:hypothetical protein MATL_G00025350 [Megalops atlanticus]|uniref:RGS domain-containing protein n=1 Tax=Megalops atlanticus TaxID=7932 RepID=A0A9D3TBK0_MEGAT|nr:hypothetical protein MATL_G00025350 [Megalops atlanticus]
MERDDKKTNKSLLKDLLCRLQCRLCYTPSAEKLNSEDTLLWAQSLERLLQSKYGMVVFRAFLKSEFSDENIDFWLTCENYKKIKSSEKMKSEAKKIYELYILAEAPKEVNIDHQTRELIRGQMKTPSRLCFDEAQNIVYRLMERDSYPRFLRSNIYKTLLDSAPGSIKV